VGFAPWFEAQKSMGFKNGMSLAHCKVQEGGLWAFVSRGARFLKHI